MTLASIGDAVIATDTEGRVTFLNPIAQDLTGWTDGDAQGQPLEVVFRIVHEQTRQPVENPVVKVLRDGGVVGLGNHTVLIARDGTERPIDDSAAPIMDTTRSAAGVILVFRDVTEQRRGERELRESEARKAAILATALDCIITCDQHGLVVEFNPAAERTFGYSRAEVIGRDMADLVIPPCFRAAHQRGMAHYLATGEGPVLNRRIEMLAQRADGTEFPVELAITPIPTDGPPLFTAYLRDITDRRRQERHRNARLAVTQVLAQAASIQDAATRILQAVCESLGWDVGFFWTLRPNADALNCLESWHRPEVPTTEFEATSRRRTFGRGEGLPGHVWATGKPDWILDVVHDANFPRAAPAAREGLHGAFGCPIVVGAETLGVIEFFSQRIREPDADLLEMMATVAGQIGQFMDRRRAEEERDRFFTVGTDMLVVAGFDGYLKRVNPAWEKVLGWTAEELTGQPWLNFVHPDDRAATEAEAERLLRGEETVSFENRYRSKDGEYHWLSWKVKPYLEERLLYGGATDITERKRGEAALRESEEKLRLLADTIPQLAWMARPDGHIFWYNRRWYDYTGTTPEEMEGWGWQSVHDPETLPKVLERWKGSITSGEPFDMVFPLKGADGMFRPFLTRVNPLRNDDGRILYWFGTNTDISEIKELEDSLRASERRFARFMQHLPGLAWIKDLQGRYVYANAAAEKAFRTPRAELYGKVDEEVFPPEIAAQFRENDQRAMTSGTGVQVVEVLEQADGVLHYSLVSKFPILGSEGQAVLVGGMAIDITEQRRAEEEVQFQAHLLDAVGQAAIATDPDGTILYWNRYAQTLYGWPKGEALGRNILEVVVAPGAAGEAAEIMERLRSGERWSGEFLVQRRDGTRFPAFVTDTPIFDRQGQLKAIIGISADITERKRVEQALRFLADASATLAAVVDYESTLQKVANLAVPYFADWSAVDVANEDGSLRRLAVAHQDADKAHLAHEMLREYPPDPQAPGGIGAVFRTGKPEIVGEITEELLVQGAKDERHLSLIRLLGLKSYICVPLVVSGNPLGVLTFATAESGRKYTDVDLALATDLAHRAAVAIENTQLYQALRETDRRKDEFLATLAHELRNPLAPIRNSLQILKMPRLDAATVERSREMMERQVHQLVRLVDDLLDVSRVMRGKIELRKEQVELSAVVARAVETVQPLIDAQGHELTVGLPPESLPLDADPVRLAQVVGNLLTNAAKYTESNGRIWLTAQRQGEEAVLRVRDTGIGLAPDMLPHIFELFVQVDHAATRSQGGLGIGLTLVKNLVEMHHGTVEAHSEGLGAGCEFVVRLPLMPQVHRQRIEEENGEAPQESARSSGHRLLVVDDNRDAADSLAMLLRLQGHEVRVAHDGLAALELAEGYRPEMVFLDIGMPGMDGYEVARRLRRQPGLENIRLAALTGWGQAEDRRRTAEAGFDHHLVKPVEPNALESLLSGLRQ